MYLHTQDWDAAMRVAEQCDPTAIMDILTAQAAAAAAAGQYQMAESLFLKAKRPEAALAMYREAGQWQAAVRLAEAYMPGKLQVRLSSIELYCAQFSVKTACRVLDT